MPPAIALTTPDEAQKGSNPTFSAGSLAEAIGSLHDPARLTADDKEFIFDAAFRHFEQLLADAPTKSAHARRSLLAYLLSAVPGLSKNIEALKWTFRSKYAAWLQAGRKLSAISDRRRVASGNFRAPEFAEDKRKIRDAAILNGGNEALAHRLLRQRGELSPAFERYYSFDVRRAKSYVPRVIRQEITPEVEMCGPIHRGPWAAKMAGPYIPRDWSGVLPGEWGSGDDITLNNYFYHYDDAGTLHIERGETLLMIDLRTGYPLHFSLIAGKYNSRHIRSLIRATHDLHGLPHNGFYFERGVWKSRFIEGDRKTDSMHWRETERGLREHGLNLEVRHATTPRAKTIEGIIRLLQDRQRNAPGYVGPNERTIEFERTQEFIRRARAGKEHPGNELLSMEQWRDRISADLAEYLAEPQNGKMIDGLSPAEAWAQRKVLRKLPDEALYFLCSHKKIVRVRQEGIVLEIGGERMLYANEQTGNLIGREVLAFYDLDTPDLLIVSDLKRQNYFSVKRVLLPALSATREQFSEVHAAISGHRKTAKVIYGRIRHPERSAIVRDDSIDETAKELGRFHNAAKADFQREQTATTRKLRKIQIASASRGVPVNPTVKNADRVLEGIQREQQALAKTQAKDAPQTGTMVPKPSQMGPIGPKSQVNTYVLKSPPAAPATGRYWSLWKQIEKLKPGLNRHALTQRTIGHHARVEAMTEADLAKMISLFESIIRECHAPAEAKL